MHNLVGPAAGVRFARPCTTDRQEASALLQVSYLTEEILWLDALRQEAQAHCTQADLSLEKIPHTKC